MVFLNSNFFVKPGSWLGLVGGGQLGRMFCHSAQNLGYKVVVLDPSDISPAVSVADLHIKSSYDDKNGLERLSSICKSVTIEFENIPFSSLEFLSKRNVLTPTASSVAIAQNRIFEKNFISSLNVDVAPYKVIVNKTDCDLIDHDFFPGILKVAKLGYDGKGQVTVREKKELKDKFVFLGEVPCVLEKFLSLDREISVVVARNLDGDCVVFPPAINFHECGILSSSVVTRSNHEIYDNTCFSEVCSIAKKIAESLNYYGVLCVEFFVVDNNIIVNEIAPRPHNSGHYSMDACFTSQFEQQVRIMSGLPLGNTELLSSSIMINLLGDVWFGSDGNLIEPDWRKLLSISGLKLHLYGKEEARRSRKMGHVTLLGNDIYDLDEKAYDLSLILGINYTKISKV
ncbi:5-(carboxyamino)imidazole ribonucleotide synthase [Candidatus Kinetoplastibacterium desouzaii TCC079E]|uniref:N5-carboxyaminoimidazole ribonucleotide synthase n=1 Tax=Candidatus Kinetoplastidibacterium desouzai TCC079E TaxID=1208919 RepID=M1L1Q5_9PROT|nr:5-(carboxyamino)imidazole ribonucleotide synthase [Candidatus Kinetoplastibacterium desouzaii]AGF46688.1 5-(carboxyamino)imidazole ribonucleotide synthase [Candidatus Kinetoplastibacterium desouzaii TCC079E]